VRRAKALQIITATAAFLTEAAKAHIAVNLLTTVATRHKEVSKATPAAGADTLCKTREVPALLITVLVKAAMAHPSTVTLEAMAREAPAKAAPALMVLVLLTEDLLLTTALHKGLDKVPLTTVLALLVMAHLWAAVLHNREATTASLAAAILGLMAHHQAALTTEDHLITGKAILAKEPAQLVLLT
jgi:hypothetical protein